MTPPAYPRELAVRVLTRVLSEHEALDDALTRLSGEIPSGARGWLQEVCAGTLRWKGRLDLAIDSAALKKKPSGWLRKILLVGAYQLVAQERTDPAPVVDETVTVVKRREGPAPAKFANAVLRRVSEHAREWRELAPPSSGSLSGSLSVSLKEEAAWASLPEWLWSRIVAAHGREWAQAFARASLERPVLWARARRPDWKPSWAEPGSLACSLRATSGGAIPDKEGFAEGEFIVQDISSQTLVADIAAHVTRERGAGFSALDLCAAPGGKSVGLAWSGAAVTSSDRDEARLRLLRGTLARAAPQVGVATREELASRQFDLVWVDAPCSGTGIVRRHPDVRWLRSDTELERLRGVQTDLVREGFGRVKPGGFFAYSVCSVLAEEGAELVRKALETALGGPLVFAREWSLQPQDSPFGDGFWAVLLKKS